MQEISELRETILRERPVPWEAIPDIPLYMDQVISYMTRQLIDLSGGEKLTSAMIHNYVKQGLLPRAEGKRYAREHIAYLTAICMLKQVIQAKDVGLLLRASLAGEDVTALYGSLTALLDEELTDAAAILPDEPDTETLAAAALRLAVSSYARQLACKRLLTLMESSGETRQAPGNK